MKLHTMYAAEGATKTRKRVGRGTGSGLGKTSGKGHKGQNARSGGGVRPGFEGGQLPLFRRLPKRGFSNAMFKTTYAVLNLSDLNKFEENTTVTPELLKEMGIIKKYLRLNKKFRLINELPFNSKENINIYIIMKKRSE